ncbi:hypothetical protein CEXT_731081 [Caerostris extrusa]|uniref:Uncharacterized protein n=1 Tax=Caerostris extrusa TaxID=172846 RepID=A0AAV4VWK0_CAEEX|nr:hypothetical protein CEXT_731081 [Caerostris extrusa]
MLPFTLSWTHGPGAVGLGTKVKPALPQSRCFSAASNETQCACRFFFSAVRFCSILILKTGKTLDSPFYVYHAEAYSSLKSRCDCLLIIDVAMSIFFSLKRIRN